MMASRSAVWQFVILVVLAPNLIPQGLETKPMEGETIQARSRLVEHPEGIEITAQLIDADTGKYIPRTSLGIEITPVDTRAGQLGCVASVPSGEASLIWKQTDETGTFSTHLEPGTFKIVFRFGEGSHAGAKFGCEIVISIFADWCRNKIEYHYTLQSTNRFRNVVATVDAVQPCQQWVRTLPFVPELPYELKSNRVIWLNEDGSPVRDSELIFEQYAERRFVEPKRPTVKVKTDQNGMADLKEVYRVLVPHTRPKQVVTLDIAEGPFRGLKLKAEGAGEDRSQTVVVKEWKYMDRQLWAAEIE